MHRFTTKATKKDDRKSRIRIAYILLPVLIALFWYLINSVDSSTLARQQESLSDALNRDILHCYAVEGFYPPSLEYLEDHYGLKYDKETFVIDYQPIASNMRPDVTILMTGKEP
jgi:hypothetical protein